MALTDLVGHHQVRSHHRRAVVVSAPLGDQDAPSALDQPPADRRAVNSTGGEPRSSWSTKRISSPCSRPRYPLLNAGDPAPPSIGVRNTMLSPSRRPSRIPRGTPRNEAVPATVPPSTRSRKRSVAVTPQPYATGASQSPSIRGAAPPRQRDRRSAASTASATSPAPASNRPRRPARRGSTAGVGRSVPTPAGVAGRQRSSAVSPGSNGWCAKSTYWSPASWNSTRFTAAASAAPSHDS